MKGKMKSTAGKGLFVLGIAFLSLSTSAIAVEESVVEQLQTDVTQTKQKSVSNESKGNQRTCPMPS